MRRYPCGSAGGMVSGDYDADPGVASEPHKALFPVISCKHTVATSQSSWEG